MEQFGVSRPTLREAFRVLESEALISVRRGAHGGARVHTPNGDVAARYAGLVLEHRGTTLADIHTARTLLEPPAVRLLATTHTDTDLTLLRATITDADDTVDDPAHMFSAQNHFHALLVELAGNQTLIVLTGMLRHIIAMAAAEQVLTHLGPEDLAAAAAEAQRAHRRTVDLIEAGDGDAAETLWRRHLEAAEPYLTLGREPSDALDLFG